MSTTCTLTGRLHLRPRLTANSAWKSSTQSSATNSPGCPGSAPASSSRLRRRRPRRPRSLHLGRHAAPVLSQHHHHHRPDWPVHRAPRGTPKLQAFRRRGRLHA
jgi:hypothetical protein